MKINVEDLYKHKGAIVYICDYRLNNNDPIHKKPIRKVLPTMVMVTDNDELPKNKKVYYSAFHFKKINNNGDVVKNSVIAPFDNTGFRVYPGISLNIFDDFNECLECWTDQINEAISVFKNYKDSIMDNLNLKINELEELKRG